MLQITAMLTMLIDHVSLVFFPDIQIGRIVGRIAFPLYAYLIVVGMSRTKDLKRYIIRLAVIGAAAQIPFMMMMGKFEINVIGTFLASALVMVMVQKDKSEFAILPVIIGAVLLENLRFDYGSYCLFLMLAYKYTSSHRLVASHFVLNIIFALSAGWVIQIFSIIPTLAIAYGSTIINSLGRIKIPRWLWLSFYPAHITALVIISNLLFTE